MNIGKRTPNRWVATFDHDEQVWIIGASGPQHGRDIGRHIATLPITVLRETAEEDEANAHMLASSPEMYDSLMDIFRACLCPEPKTLKGWKQRHELIAGITHAALAKVEGRS